MSLAAAIASSSESNDVDRRDRAEDLLLEQPGLGRHVAEHGGLVEVAGAVERASRRRAALAPLRDRVVDQLGDLVALVVVDQRARRRRPPRCRGRP